MQYLKNTLRLIGKRWLFYLSLAALLVLEIPLDGFGFAVIALALITCLLLAPEMEKCFQLFRESRWPVRIFSMLTTAGVCWYAAQWYFKLNGSGSLPFAVARKLVSLTSISKANAARCIALPIAAIALPAAFILCAAFWEKLRRILSDETLLPKPAKGEAAVYAGLTLLLCALSVYAYTRTGAFFGQNMWMDVIYTTDTGGLITLDNAYLALTHDCNDLHQLLFGLFSMPFLGAPYLLSELLPKVPFGIPLLMNLAQIPLLMLANMLFASAVAKTPRGRVCYVLIACLSYSCLIFSLTLEQYIVSYFWMALLVGQLANGAKADELALVGAGGTMVTTLALTPWASEHHILRDFKAWFADMLKWAGKFFAAVFASGGLISLRNMWILNNVLSSSVGANLISFKDRLVQFFPFVRTFFWSPKNFVCMSYRELFSWLEGMTSPETIEGLVAGMMKGIGSDHASWQMVAEHSINFLGVAILAFAGLSLFLNRKKRVCRIAGYWIAFSFVITVVIGYGVAENGLILYALYFGWPYLVLLYSLLTWLEERLHSKWILPLAAAAFAVSSLLVNLPAMRELFDFALTYYPLVR